MKSIKKLRVKIIVFDIFANNKPLSMTLIKSISGIRGTIGGNPGDNLTPVDIVKFAMAYASLVKSNKVNKHPKVVIGRDARLSWRLPRRRSPVGLVGAGFHFATAI